MPPRLPSPIKMSRMALLVPSDCSHRCRNPALAVLQLPNGRRMVLCEAHLEYYERLGK